MTVRRLLVVSVIGLELAGAETGTQQECPYTTYKPLLAQTVAVGPLCVTGSAMVSREALAEAGRMLAAMLARRPDVSTRLRDAGALTAVFAADEGVYELSYFEDLAGTASCEAQGGLGGVPRRPVTACSERNVLQMPEDPFGRGSRPDGENVCVHELAHTIMNVGLSDSERDRIAARFSSAEAQVLWSGDFALQSADEFFAEMSQAYFCANPEVEAFLHTHGVNCADELRDYDIATFDLIDTIYSTPDLR